MAQKAESAKTAELISAHVDIDKEDILAVGISEVEEQLQESKAKAIKDKKIAEKELGELQKCYREQLQATADAIAADKDEAIKGFAAAGFKKVKAVASDVSFSEEGKTNTVRFSIYYKMDAEEMRKRVGAFTFNVSSVEEVRAPKELNQLRKDIDKKNEEISARHTEAVECQKRLANMAQYERKLRARLAKLRLASTTEGQHVLTTMVDNAKEDILKLPVM